MQTHIQAGRAAPELLALQITQQRLRCVLRRLGSCRVLCHLAQAPSQLPLSRCLDQQGADKALNEKRSSAEAPLCFLPVNACR